MQNVEAWQPTKFEQGADGHWQASRTQVPLTSRLMADRVALAYGAAIPQHARGRLADLGCGTVPLYGLYRDLVEEVTCIDWGDSLHPNRFVDRFADLNQPLDGLDAQFETVIASDVIEHLHTPEALFASASRMLVGGGKLIIGVPFLYWLHEQPHDHHRYTEFALARMCAEAGLEVVSIEPYGGGPEVVADLLCKMLIGGRRLRLGFAVLSWLLRRERIQAISQRTARTMPLGYVLVAQKPV
ncbi:MAG: methyltransferase domain-containing protein [Pseudomonadota bacterium]